MIRCEKVCKSFGGAKVLDAVDFTVARGERVVLIGPSGGGKSLLLRSLARLEEPDSGRIFIAGREITAPDADVDAIRRRMGLVSQGFHLFHHLDVLENIMLGPTHLLGLSRAEAAEEAGKLLKSVGLENRRHAMPRELSGGQQQRIAIARALAMKPELLLFDEPTSALDPGMSDEVLAVIRALAREGMTMLIVTHKMDFARDVATRVAFFDDGRVREEGTPGELFDDPSDPRTATFVRNLKYFHEHISEREFDLMRLQGGILAFAQKYGIDRKLASRLQLCVEELIVELLEGCGTCKGVSLDVSIGYGGAARELTLECVSRGARCNPFEREPDPSCIGLVLLRNLARKIDFVYENGDNKFTIALK